MKRQNKTNIAEKYLRKRVPIVDIICIMLIVVGVFVATFVQDGLFTSGYFLVPAIVVLIISKEARVKDSDFDDLLLRIVKENGLPIEDKNVLKSYDLKKGIVIKGKDNSLRSRFFYITEFNFDDAQCQVSINEIDMVNATVSKNEISVPRSTTVSVTEDFIQMGTYRKSISYLHFEGIDDVLIPVDNNSLDTDKITNKFGEK